MVATITYAVGMVLVVGNEIREVEEDSNDAGGGGGGCREHGYPP